MKKKVNVNDLIEAYVEGSIKEAQLKQLEQEIQNDQDVALRLARALKNDIYLQQMLTRDMDVDSKVIRLNRPTNKRPSSKRKHKGQQPSGWAYPTLMAIASCLILGFGIHFFIQLKQTSPTTPQVQNLEPNGSETASNPQTDPNPSTQPTLAIKVMQLEGPVHLIRDGKTTPFKNTKALAKGDMIESLSAGRVKLKLKDEDTYFHLDPNSKMVLLDDIGKTWQLVSGSIGSMVQKQQGLERLKVRTNEADFEILGTIFHIHSEQNNSLLKVMEGKVRMTRKSDRKSVSVSRGNYTESRDPQMVPNQIGVKDDTNIEILSLSLINPNTQQPYALYQNFQDGQIIELAQLENTSFNFDVHTQPEKIGSMFIEVTGPDNFHETSTESYFPYTLGNKTKTISEAEPPNYFEYPIEAGEYTVKITPYQYMHTKGKQGKKRVFKFIVK